MGRGAGHALAYLASCMQIGLAALVSLPARVPVNLNLVAASIE